MMEKEKSNREDLSGSKSSRNGSMGDRESALLDAAVDSIKKLPDIREEKIKLVKKRLLSGYYDTLETREILISKLIHFLKKRIT